MCIRVYLCICYIGGDPGGTGGGGGTPPRIFLGGSFSIFVLEKYLFIYSAF